jgi:hypothetical protein
MSDKEKKYPEGHIVGMWMCICIAVFSGFGIPLSIITHNHGFIGIGPAMGVAIGTLVGQSIENKYKKEGKIRPLSEYERKRKKNTITAGIIILTLGIATLMVLLFI